MSIAMRALLIAGSLLTALYVLFRVRKSRMRTEDSVFWLAFSLVLVIMGLLPGAVAKVARKIGFISAANLVFLVVIFLLIIKLFLMDQRISTLQKQTTDLAQGLAIERREREAGEPERDVQTGKEKAGDSTTA